ncbi:hypothetical protein [Nitrospira japonica]|nr:hypothetical protein [Nitrospira japonica]
MIIAAGSRNRLRTVFGAVGCLILVAGVWIIAPGESAYAAGGTHAALDTPPGIHTISGTLSMLDVKEGKGTLTTDLDKPVFFRLTRPDLFERLSIGDRVTIQLDEEGRAVKVIEALPAEVHEPPPPPNNLPPPQQ